VITEVIVAIEVATAETETIVVERTKVSRRKENKY
jgi:hypothetical protein